MIKDLLLSIQPQHLYNILIGKKTLELRKSVPKDFKGWVYLYCTKAKPYLSHYVTWDIDGYSSETYNCENKYCEDYSDEVSYYENLNGKVVACFWFDEYEKLKPSFYPSYITYEITNDMCSLLQLSQLNIDNYGKGKALYAWHIKKLKIFDEPMALSEFMYARKKINKAPLYMDIIDGYPQGIYRLTKAPQSYQYVWVKE